MSKQLGQDAPALRNRDRPARVTCLARTSPARSAATGIRA